MPLFISSDSFYKLKTDIKLDCNANGNKVKMTERSMAVSDFLSHSLEKSFNSLLDHLY